ncbi:protein amnionless-like [Ornithodoros turicata]|uniref:protein amnionless-like n=1 Tax=Ornithodoros turicata TaxID=34597 RepID=UPI003138B3A0
MFPFVILLLSGRALGDVKEWMPDTRYSNPSNWDGGQVPCAAQQALLKGAVNMSVLLDSQVDVNGMVLPENGELVLANGASITVHTSTPPRRMSQKCEEQSTTNPTVQYVAGERVHWYGADNWRLKSSSRLHRATADDAAIPLAVPDSERVPCSGDHVVFHDRNFHVNTDELVPLVRSIQIGGQIYDAESLSRLRLTTAGRLMVEGDIQTSDTECQDGCICGNDNEDAMARICIQRAPNCPLEFPCADPVVPLSSCCSMCGSFLVLRPQSDGFRFEDIVQLVTARVLQPQFDNQVQTYVHKTSDGRVQIVLADVQTATGRPEAHALARELYNVLMGEGKSRYAVSSANLTGSTAWTGAGEFALTAVGSNLPLILGLLFAILIIAGLVVAYWFLRKRHFSFKGHPVIPWARFDEGRVELELGTTPHEELVPTGFANPLTSPFKVFPEYGPDENESGTFSNPVFDAAEREAAEGGAESQSSKPGASEGTK